MSDFYGAYDKPHKPYIPIDTYSPAGTWIEEKHYNRSRPTGNNARKVLCGNWQEEQALESDMLQRERNAAEATASGSKNSSFNGTASLDVICDKGNGRFAGGFESSPYLTKDSKHPELRSLATTHRTDYNEKNGDVKALRRPELGVRSQLLLQQALAAAAEEQAAARERQQQLAGSSSASKLRRDRRGMSGIADADSDPMTDHTTAHSQSVYKTTMCDANEVLPTVEYLQQDYLVDEPITLYTGNPYTEKIMTVHGKTPVDTNAPNRFGRHTYFSDSKYGL